MTPTDHDQHYSVMMHGRICIPVTLCHQMHPSIIVHSDAHGVKVLRWRDLSVNRIYDNITNTTKFCFDDVNENFLFLEYCNVGEEHGCMMSASIFCCNWAEFVSRTHVNVIGDTSKSYTPAIYDFHILSCIQDLVIMVIILFLKIQHHKLCMYICCHFKATSLHYV